MTVDNMAIKLTEVSTITCIGFAAPDTAQATAKEQCLETNETGGLVITWADGNGNFDNVATDLTTFSYS